MVRIRLPFRIRIELTIYKWGFFEERGKAEYPEKNPLEQGWELTTNWIHICRRPWNSTPGQTDGRQMLLPMSHLATEVSLWTSNVCLFFLWPDKKWLQLETVWSTFSNEILVLSKVYKKWLCLCCFFFKRVAWFIVKEFLGVRNWREEKVGLILV